MGLQFFNLILFILCASPLAHSRNIPHNSKTTLLNVADSIQKTHQVLNFKFNQNNLKQQQHKSYVSSLSSSTLSLQLHSRASIYKSSHADYKSLTLSRLDLSYGDGSYTVGDFVTETVTIGATSVQNIAIGCGHNNEGLFVGAAGLLGLGGGPLSFPAQLNTTSFSYCLVDRDSDLVSTLEFDSPFSRNAVTAPLRRNPQLDTFYYVGLVGISVGGELLPIPETSFTVDATGSGGIIVDSGTAVTRLQSDVYDVVRDAFVNGTKDLPTTNGVSLFDTCYDLSAKTSVEVPTVAFHFGEGKVLVMPAKNYLVPVDSVGTFCFAFASTTSSLGIIGNIQQQGTRVSFDIENSLIGFSPNSWVMNGVGVHLEKVAMLAYMNMTS
ncbi:hypothetical protein TSUD_50720 [Trifolium subterraneum]|uniref:Peptidase A1 domain-containing protein n=1 Tax=Trifolium subterraneum TaxID=3900 RepID=A0A2Z6M428_TRISU|nr:hypothetical protein TSUD_50720 [Trifolium subterraneum]